MKRLAFALALVAAIGCESGPRNTKKLRDEACTRNLDCGFGLDCADAPATSTSADGGTVAAAAARTCQYHVFGDCEGDGTQPGAAPQCVSGQKCRDGHCTVQCAGKGDCQQGEVCKIGVCQRAQGKNYAQCYDNRDCQWPEACFYGQCVTRTGSMSCQTDVDCGAGLRCIDRRCM